MVVRKGYRYKLKTNAKQEHEFRRYAGARRFVWNHFLGLQKERLQNGQKLLPYKEMSTFLTGIKQLSEYAWMKDIYSQCLQQTLMDLDKAIWEAMDKTNPKAFPVFKRKGRYGDAGFRIPQGFEVANGCIWLPKMKQRIRYFDSGGLTGQVRNVTITQGANGWFVSMQTETQVEESVHPSTSAIGVDRGVTHLVALSDGKLVGGMTFLKDELTKLKREQRKLSRKQKESNNWKKQCAKVRRKHETISNKRKDQLHKLSDQLSKNHALICVEDLQVRSMTASATGTVEQPGKNVKQKSGLNRRILEQGWGELVRQLEYKSRWRGGKVVKVPAAYTSQRCSCCGTVAKENRFSQGQFKCIACGHEANADVNAAKNILAAGHAVAACGEEALAPSVKQEPSRAAKSPLLEFLLH